MTVKFPEPKSGSPDGVLIVVSNSATDGGFSLILYVFRISSVDVFLTALNHFLHPWV